MFRVWYFFFFHFISWLILLSLNVQREVLHLGQRHLTATEKIQRVEQGRKFQSQQWLQQAYSFSKSTSLWLAGSVVLSKHLTHYGSLSGFQYCNMRTPIQKDSLILHPDAVSIIVGLHPGNIHQYLEIERQIQNKETEISICYLKTLEVNQCSWIKFLLLHM